MIERLRTSARPKLSIRAAAEAAGMSDARWRQIAKGHNQASRDVRVPARAPDDTLARMARVVGATPDQLREVGREDAADELERLTAAASAATTTITASTQADGFVMRPSDWRQFEGQTTERWADIGTLQARLAKLPMAALLYISTLVDLILIDIQQGDSHAEPVAPTTDPAASTPRAQGAPHQEGHAGDGQQNDKPEGLTEPNQGAQPDARRQSDYDLVHRTRDPRVPKEIPDESDAAPDEEGPEFGA